MSVCHGSYKMLSIAYKVQNCVLDSDHQDKRVLTFDNSNVMNRLLIRLCAKCGFLKRSFSMMVSSRL